MIEKLTKAPYFRLRNQNNEWVSLDDYKGQRVFVFFSESINELHTMTIVITYINMIERFEKIGVKVLGIFGSSVEELAAKAKELRIPFPLLSDECQEARQAYEVWRYKPTFGTPYWITVKSALIVGADGMVEHVFKRINMEQYAWPVIKYLEHKYERDEWRKLSRRTKERIRREHDTSYKQGTYVGAMPKYTKTLK